MDNEILDIILNDFAPEQRNSVVEKLTSISLNHVMCESEFNLKNTRMSILYLTKGSLSSITELTKSAKIDFRDVIMWAAEEKKKERK